MRSVFIVIALAAIAVIGNRPASASCPSYPYTFSNGSTADAGQVNANFSCAAKTQGDTLDSTTFTGTTTFSGPVNNSGTVSAPTFSSSAMARVFLTNSSAQSVPNSTTTNITGWTAGRDATSICNLSTGVCTATSTADYLINEHVTLSGTMPVPTGFQCPIAVNGVQVADDIRWVTNSGENINSCDSQALVRVSAGQPIVAQIFQNSGSALTLFSSSILTYLVIEQLP